MNYRFTIGAGGYQGIMPIGNDVKPIVYSTDYDKPKKLTRKEHSQGGPRNLTARQRQDYTGLRNEARMMREQMQRNNAEGKPNGSLQKGIEEAQTLISLYEKIADNKDNPDALNALELEVQRVKTTLKNRAANGMLSPRLRKSVPEIETMYKTAKLEANGGAVAPDLDSPVIVKPETKPVSLPTIATGLTLLYQLIK